MGEQKPPSKSRERIKKIFKHLVPYVALVAYTCGAAGIYYAVEKDCGKDGNRKPLTFWSSVHFVACVQTTIGYGDVYPCTLGGRILAIVFAMLGMPLTLLCLERLGRWMEIAVTALWRDIKSLSYFNKKSRVHPKNSNGHEEDEDVPISFAILCAVLWVLISTCYFYFSLKKVYENDIEFQWDFFMAFYFTMISYLTIGLGDVSPKNYDYVFLNCLFMFFGLALLTMCITIIQTKLEHLFEQTRKLIMKEYASKLQQQETDKTLSPVDENFRKDVKQLLRKSGPTWLRNMVSERDIQRLVSQYRKDCQMVNRQTQTVVDVAEIAINTEEEEAEDGDEGGESVLRKRSADSDVIVSLCANCGRPMRGNKTAHGGAKRFGNDVIVPKWKY